MNEIYNLTASIPHIMPTNIKEKTANMLISIITKSRLGQMMSFNSFARMDFDDEKDSLEMHPIVSLQDSFNRLKTNCIVFNVFNNDINDNKYNMCFVYHHSSAKDIINYGYIMYNSKTQKSYHCFYIEPEYDEITRHLIQFFYSLKEKSIFDFYSKKYDALHNNSKDDEYDYSVSGYKKMIKDYRNRFPYNPYANKHLGYNINRFAV